jgi:hypothetical protein
VGVCLVACAADDAVNIFRFVIDHNLHTYIIKPKMDAKLSWFGHINEGKTRKFHRLHFHTDYATLQIQGTHVSCSLIVSTEDLTNVSRTKTFALSNAIYDPLKQTLTFNLESDQVSLTFSKGAHEHFCGLLEDVKLKKSFTSMTWETEDPRRHGLRESHDYMQ